MAVLLAWALFLLWTVLGLAALRLGRHRWALPTLLLAPTVGFAAVLVPTYAIVRFGVPVRLSAVPVLAGLLAAAVVVLWRARPDRVRARGLWRQGRAFAVILVGAFGLTAWPLVDYGFDWVANGNDDMANYCLVATGYRDHAFAAVPRLADLQGDHDGTQSFWPFYILYQVRSGTEMLLATTSAVTGLSAQQVFMPVIGALNLALVAAACGLAVIGAGRRAGVFAGIMLAASSMMAYGVVQQLIAQVGGLALLCTALALTTGRFRRLSRGALLRRACACGLVFAGLLAAYPEVIPILVGGCAVLGVWDLVRGRLDRRLLVHAGAALLVMLVLLPVYAYGAATFMFSQSGQTGTTEALKEIFPFYLTPRGLALIWGLLPIAGPEGNWFQSACIVTGFVLLVALVAPTVRDVGRRRAFAAGLGVIAVLVAVLAVQGAAFGLFKAAMFAQPFLWAVVGAWVARRRPRALRVAVPLLVLLAALNARTQFWYVDQSRGVEYRVELPAPSARHALAEFRALYQRRAAAGPVDRVLLATENTVLLKLLAAEVRGVPTDEVGIAPLREIASGGLAAVEGAPWVRVHREWKEPILLLRAEFAETQDRDRPALRDPETGRTLHRLMNPTPDLGTRAPDRTLVAAGGGGLSVLNRSQFPETGPQVICAALSELHNFAVFCDATGAQQHYLGQAHPETVALYQLERDPMFPARTMAGVGRAMVLEVLNPSRRVRVLIDHTTAFKSDPGARTVAPLEVVGDRRVALGAIGSGGSRLVSAALAPQAVGPGRYLAISFGNNVQLNVNRLAAAEQLWGTEFPRDRRRLSGHAREISVLSEEEYAAFRPPQALARFPDDLAHPHLEYSGFFEHGWLATAAKVRLMQPEAPGACVIRGAVPGLPGAGGFRTELTVLIDGAPVERRTLAPGDFEVRTPAAAAAGPHWIELRFSHAQVMPAPDGRSLTAIIRFIGFETKPGAPARVPLKLLPVPAEAEPGR
jgi:hypothetical protein